jgi:HlyD family secretion protein
MANANLVYARQQFSRTSQLTAAGFASHQDLDKATAAVETANANLSRAKELYEAARRGPTREERAVADAAVEAAAAAVAVVAARVAKLRITAPSDGTVA